MESRRRLWPALGGASFRFEYHFASIQILHIASCHGEQKKAVASAVRDIDSIRISFCFDLNVTYSIMSWRAEGGCDQHWEGH